MSESSPSDDDEEIECIDSLFMQTCNRRRRRRYIESIDYISDDDDMMELAKPIDIFPWSSLKKKQPTGVGAGLNNSGNTCYIASVLQCLTHTVPLLNSLGSYQSQFPCNCGNESFCVLDTLQNHIKHALKSSGNHIKIHRFRDNIKYFSSDFEINNQEDAHEFLQSLFDKLEKCCLDRTSRDNLAASVSSQSVNIVDHVFGGRLVSKLRCCNCSSVSETYETSLGWSLEIEEDVEDISSALESFTCVEKLEDKATCDECKEKVSKEKQLKFDKLPLVATFHLKRFKNNGVYAEKISKDVMFPLELDLLPYMSTNQNPQVSTKYHLYAMVEHLGGISYGHYEAYVRSAPETWHHFDDAEVGRISEECVLSKNAYMLFYAREGTPCFASAFKDPNTLFEATPMSFSPTSVLETGHSYQNVISRCDEPQDEVFHSAESKRDAEFLSFESQKVDDDSEKPFAERPLYPDGNRVATICEEAYLNLKIQKPNLSPQGMFQIKRAHLQNKKKKAETRGAKLCRSFVGADPKEKKNAVSYLRSRPCSLRSRLLTAALGVCVKRKKVSNLRRSNLNRNLPLRQSDESL